MFQKLSWSGQLLAGLVLFGVSFLIEALVLTAYFGNPLFGFAVAGGLEASKVLAIVLYRILREQTIVAYPRSVRGSALAFRTALFGLSAACSVMFLAEQLDRPNLGSVRDSDLAGVTAAYETDLALARERHRQRADQVRSDLAARDASGREALDERFRPLVDDLEQRLEREMDNVVGGIFKGPRYREIADRLEIEKTAYAAAVSELDQRFQRERNRLVHRLHGDLDAELQELIQVRDQRLAAVRSDNYAGDYRAEHPLARAFVGVLAAVFEQEPSTLQFVFFFSLFLSLTMELGIIVAFEHITLARLPVFTAEHRLGVSLREQEVRTDAELRSFEMDDELSRAKLKRKRESIEEVLRGDDKLAKDDRGPRNAA